MSITPQNTLDYLISIMQMFRILSRLDEVAEFIGNNNGVEIINNVMKFKPESIDIQVNGCACFANLASIESNRTKMLHDGSIKNVLRNMTKYMNYPQVQAEICATLANLTTHQANAQYIYENHGCQLVLKAMRMHLDQIDLQVQAFHALSGLGKLVVLILERENFVELALKSLQRHKNIPELVSAGWHTLGSLANSGFNLGQERDLILPMILDTIKQYSDNSSFLITACFGLAHIFFNNREQHIDDEVVKKYHGVELLLDVMRNHPSNQSLQTTAIFALGSMVSKSATNRKTVLKNNGVQLIIRRMKQSAKVSKSAPLRISELALAVRTPEPVLYSPQTENVKCPKPVLLQLFGSVALLNLSETSI